ncbi:hypothetical protein ACI65C_013575 [Semiaphis heraclei]
MDRRTSDIWKHFSKIDSSIAKCDTCKKSYSYKTSVTNLKKHLNNAHLIYLYTENDTLQNEPEVDVENPVPTSSCVQAVKDLSTASEPSCSISSSIVSQASDIHETTPIPRPNPLKRSRELTITNFTPKKFLLMAKKN